MLSTFYRALIMALMGIAIGLLVTYVFDVYVNFWAIYFGFIICAAAFFGVSYIVDEYRNEYETEEIES